MTKHITEAETKKVARLARLHVNEANLSTYAESLSNILDFIAEVNNLDTKDVIPMASPFPDAILALREDKVTATDQRSLLQSLAPSVESGLYLVPQVIE